MDQRGRIAASHLMMLAIGLALGLGYTGLQPRVLHATGGDRSNESILAAGPVSVLHNKVADVQVAQDAIYYLDYRATKLMATVPTFKVAGSAGIITSFAERDLVADFKLDLDTGVNPHFLMTTGSVNSSATTIYGEGLAILYVLETTTRQIASYKMNQFQIGNVSQNRLDLLEIKSFGKPLGTAAQ